MTEYEYQTEVVAKRMALESKETNLCKGCRNRLGVPCLKAWKCQLLDHSITEHVDKKGD